MIIQLVNSYIHISGRLMTEYLIILLLFFLAMCGDLFDYLPFMLSCGSVWRLVLLNIIHVILWQCIAFYILFMAFYGSVWRFV